MTMYQLVIDDEKCVGCGNCYGILKDRKDIFRKNGRVLISSRNLEDNDDQINYMLETCYLDAITLEEYMAGEEDGQSY